MSYHHLSSRNRRMSQRAMVSCTLLAVGGTGCRASAISFPETPETTRPGRELAQTIADGGTDAVRQGATAEAEQVVHPSLVLPEELRVVATISRWTPMRVFPNTSGALVVAHKAPDESEAVSVRRIADSRCTRVDAQNALPRVGLVDLNLDPARRWGLLRGVSEHKLGLRNLGKREITVAGLTSSSQPWVVMETEPRVEAPAITLSDFYSLSEEHWQLQRSTKARSSVWTTWQAAASCAVADEIAALEWKRRRPTGRTTHSWSVQLWGGTKARTFLACQTSAGRPMARFR